MTELIGTLIPILLTDVVNPVLFAFMVYAVGTDRPFLNSGALLIGHTVAYFIAGVILAIWLEAIMDRLNSAEPADYGASVVIGALLVWFAFRSRSDTGKRPENTEPPLTPVASFFYGAIVNFIGIPFAVPYFAALGQIMKADLTAPQGYATLIAYNTAYAVPFLIVPILRLAMGEGSRDLLGRINERVEQFSAILMPVLFGLLGAALIINAASFFTYGEPLF
ncbi:MAG: GAP family protein [Gammaproteobacteria bacterium]